MKFERMTGLLKRGWKAVASVVGLVVLVLYSSGSCREKIEPGEIAALRGMPLPSDAVIAEVVAEPYAPRVEVVGTVASEEKIHLSARISGSVKQILVSAGSAVKKGDVLVRIDSREIDEQLAAADAQRKQAETEYQRAKQLLQNKATTEQAFIAAESAFNAARAQVDRVRVMLSYAEIVSPIDGIVTDRRIEAGDLANPGQVLLTVYDPLRLRLEAPVPSRLVSKLGLGQDVMVKIDGVTADLKGKVTQIVSEVDAMSRTRTVKIELQGDIRDILPGTFGRLYVMDDPRMAVRVPASAVYRTGQMEWVQVVEEGRALRRLVKAGAIHDGQVEILSGLSAGARVLVNPMREG